MDGMSNVNPVSIGVDLGTQSVKVLAVGLDGTVLAEAARPLTSTRDGVRHEQDPHEWLAATAAATAEAVGRLDPDQRAAIAAVSLCGTSGTVIEVDAAGRPAGPAIMYDDARAAAEAAEVAAADPARWDRLGYRIQPSWGVATIVHAARGGLPAGHRFAHQPDVVAAAMCGGPVATDWSSALKSGYDLLELAWPTDVLGGLGVDPGTLPDVVAPGAPLGTVAADWAERTGIPAGTPVVGGMTDGCASQLGAGAIGDGDWHCVIGTTLVLKGVTSTPLKDDGGAVYSHRSPVPGRWLPGGASSVGAGALGALLPGADLPGLTIQAQRLWDDGASVVPAYPLTGTGERFPFVRPDAGGFALVDGVERDLSVLGFGADAYLSVIVGVAALERTCIDVLAAAGGSVDGRYSTSGGGTRSDLWNQLRADMLQRPVTIPRSAEPAVGAAILAASSIVGAETEADWTALVRGMSGVASVVEPRRESSERLLQVHGRLADAWRARGWLA
ncbi:carbohydrate kinase [Aeromicrobium sp. 636]|nr:carbohydrate kinase [Aeromicrobium sp. 636]MTB89428.1 carbohydrate kinase [Aeromicrobium senzhongii]